MLAHITSDEYRRRDAVLITATRFRYKNRMKVPQNEEPLTLTATTSSSDHSLSFLQTNN